MIKYGFILPPGDREAAEMAHQAEEAGWDGLFVSEVIWHTDAWITLAAAAMRTERIRLGTMLTPAPTMRPWKLASKTATLDRLSNGRVILSLGLGVVFMGYQGFPDEVTDRKIRAELLDESIDILSLLYAGKPAKFGGKHYHIDLTALDEQYYAPRPVQQPRIPIWVVGAWMWPKSMQRVLRCDGLIPTVMSPGGQSSELQPEHIREMKDYVDTHRTLNTPFDIVVEGQTVGMTPAQMVDKVQPWIDAGATWWLESFWNVPQEQVVERLRMGPPRERN